MRYFMFFGIVMLLQSCGSSTNFAKRKYTKGVYRPKHGLVKSTKQRSNPKDSKIEHSETFVEENLIQSTKASTNSTEVSDNLVQRSKMEDNDFSEDQQENIELELSKTEETFPSENEKPDKKKPNKANLAYAFSIVAICLVASSIAYAFIIMLVNWFATSPSWLLISLIPPQIVGIVFAIFAMVLGIMSYLKQKNSRSLKGIIVGSIALLIAIILLINLIILL